MEKLHEYAAENILYDYLYDYYEKFIGLKEIEIEGALFFDKIGVVLERYVKRSPEKDFELEKSRVHIFEILNFVYEKFKSEIQTMKDEIQSLRTELKSIEKAPN